MGIICSQCGSNDMVQNGDFFVCRFCNTMMPAYDAKVIVENRNAGFDPNDQYSNYRLMANQALIAQNYELARSYYRKAYELNPNDWDACLLSGALSSVRERAEIIRNHLPPEKWHAALIEYEIIPKDGRTWTEIQNFDRNTRVNDIKTHVTDLLAVFPEERDYALREYVAYYTQCGMVYQCIQDRFSHDKARSYADFLEAHQDILQEIYRLDPGFDDPLPKLKSVAAAYEKQERKARRKADKRARQYKFAGSLATVFWVIVSLIIIFITIVVFGAFVSAILQ